ncbi:unnamed protein product, partial [Prunus brigantina]
LSDPPSVRSRVCKDFDELNSVVQQLRNEVVVLHHEKGQVEERVLLLEKSTSHAEAVLREKRCYKGVGNVKIEDDGEKVEKIEDDGEEVEKTEDVERRLIRLRMVE